MLHSRLVFFRRKFTTTSITSLLTPSETDVVHVYSSRPRRSLSRIVSQPVPVTRCAHTRHRRDSIVGAGTRTACRSARCSTFRRFCDTRSILRDRTNSARSRCEAEEVVGTTQSKQDLRHEHLIQLYRLEEFHEGTATVLLRALWQRIHANFLDQGLLS
ncbi:hypothetical protein EXIGLDRAFT_308521 [Exidia glandulosa HHB12029]|uniref:Uncharacterized protein n=1 Tax=Exidia glandulosa HHB12029 TaxID=1314781 RepID=A0A165LWF2_EXIGL|nr:hypothetical protein EXIGLDRAFT_308521 [Exidia glandulosa HHB12029]